jgi:AcrR family transcriptional regulator
MRCIANDGYRRTTFDRIAEVSGLSRGLVSYHFKSKARLMEVVLETIRQRMAAAIQDAERGTPTAAERLTTLLDDYLARVAQDSEQPTVVLILAAESVSEDQSLQRSVREAFAGVEQDVKRCLTEGIERGEINAAIDVAGTAGVVQAILRGAALHALVDPAGFDLAATRETAAAMLRRQLRP